MTHIDIINRIAEDIQCEDCEDLDFMIDKIHGLLIEPELKDAYARLIHAAVAHFDL